MSSLGVGASACWFGRSSLGNDSSSDDGMISDLIHAPGYATVVKFSWQKILGEICDQLGTKTDKQGVVNYDSGLCSGWIEIEKPVLGQQMPQREVFVSKQTPFHFEAMEGAAEAAVDFFVKHRGIIVKDVHYDEVKASERKDMVATCEERVQLLCQRYNYRLAGLRELCKQYRDVIPAEPMNVATPVDGHDVEKLIFNGSSMTPGKREDEFVLALVEAINKIIDMDQHP